ncbi:MAG: AbrB/MazE/SpoVT family DNA-binding domain-containing protein [Rhodospirillales bacterium CG15_BIG_FIL_POST_REV_8_21_14_020_66_15]|nr:MAG: AbrB/MazE/SpoVT family DNA-binding domain-containing protein [Rhodospirillales bacterium CG15_BIG_FIL_POST_REV_8_21_14_020_66_15]
MTEASVFRNNRSQAVRLPKDVALPETVKRVEVIKVGAGRLIVPVDASWETFFDGPAASEDFMAPRDQPPAQEREPL